MNDDRENGIVEIISRISSVQNTLSISTFKRNPTRPANGSDLTCIFLIEDVDEITNKKSTRGGLPFPCRRELEIPIEIIAKDSVSIRDLYKGLRKAILYKEENGTYVPNPQVTETAYIYERRSEGPLAYGLPGIHIIRLILVLNYVDNGVD